MKPGQYFSCFTLLTSYSQSFLQRVFWISPQINQKTGLLSTAREKKSICHVFQNKMFYKSGYECYMNKLLCENLQDTEASKTGTFGLCKC